MFTVRQSLNCSKHTCPHALALKSDFLGLRFHKHFLTGIQTLRRRLKLSKGRMAFFLTLLKTLRNHLGLPPGVSRIEAEALASL